MILQSKKTFEAGACRRRLVLVAVSVLLSFNVLGCWFGTPTPDVDEFAPAGEAAIKSSEPVDPLSVEAVLTEYLDALKAGEFEKAASCFSPWSLEAMGADREDVVLALEKLVFEENWALVDYRIVEIEEGPTSDVRVARVWAKEQSESAGEQHVNTYDFSFVLARQTDGSRMINFRELVDAYECDVAPQDHGGLIVRPVWLVRYLDRVNLVFEVSNTGESVARWGWVGGGARYETSTGWVYSCDSGQPEVLGGTTLTAGCTFRDDRFIAGEPVGLELVEWSWLSESGLPARGEWSYKFDLAGACVRQSAAGAAVDSSSPGHVAGTNPVEFGKR